jgi:RHS repeat-associated protein
MNRAPILAAVLLGSVAATSAAQVPVITITPNSGSYSVGAQVNVTITWCSPFDLFDAPGNVTFNGMNVNGDFPFMSGSDPECDDYATSQGTVTLVAGTNTLQADICNTSGCGQNTAYYTGGTMSVSVTPDNATAPDRLPFTTGYSQSFTVTNTGSVADTYTLTCPVSNLTCTSIVPSGPIPLGASASTGVTVNYNTGAIGSGYVILRATSAAATDDGLYWVTTRAIPVVLPDAEPALMPPGTGRTFRFTIRSTASTSKTYNLSLVCTGSASACSGVPAQVTIGASQAVEIVGTFNVSGATFPAGTVTLTATDSGDPLATDAGSAALKVAPTGPVVERDLCFTIAAGAAAASECGDLRVVHVLPAVRSLNRTRAPTLVYNSQHAHPYPLVSTDVTLPPADPLPTTVRAIIRVNGLQFAQRDFPGTAWGSPGQTRRVVIGFDADTFSTGVYPFELEIQRITASPPTLLTVSGSLPIVNRKASAFGAGWWLAGYEKLYVLPAGQVVWVGGDGSLRRYERAGAVGTDTAYLAPPVDHPDTLLHRVDGTWRRILPGGAFVTFSSAGFHQRTTTRLGHYTEFTLDAGLRLATIRTPPADSGLTYEFAYDGAGKLQSVSVPDSAPGAFRVTSVVVASGRLTSITDPASPAVQFAYDPAFANVMVSRTDRRSATTTFQFDANARRLVKSQLVVNVGDTVRATLCPAEGRGITSCAPTVVKPESVYTRLDGPRVATDSADVSDFWLDQFGSPWKVRDPYGYLTTVARSDARWPARATRVQYPNGWIIAATFDGRGHLGSFTDSTVVSAGVYATTRYEWNMQWDALTKVTLPNGQFTTFGVDPANGNRLWQEDRRGISSRVTYGYYATGSCIGLIRTVAVPGGATDSVSYDGRCNAARVRSPLGFVDSIRHDRLGRTTRVSAPAGSGRRQDSTFYDSRDRVIRTVVYGPALGGAPAEAITVRNYYDPESNLDSVARTQLPNPTGLATLMMRWVFDAANRPIVGIAPDGFRDSTWYNAASVADSVRTRNGQRIKMTYDRMNRLRRRIVPAVTYEQQQSPGFMAQLDLWQDSVAGPRAYPWFPNNGTSYTIAADTAIFGYDSAGNLIRADNGDARVRRGFLKSGQVAVDTLFIRPHTGWDSTIHRYVLSYGYDINGRLRILRHPSQLVVGTGMRDSVTYVYSDTTGALARVYGLHAQDSTRFVYNLRGDLIRSDLPGSIYDSLAYDLDGRLTFNRIRNGSTSPYKDPSTYLRATTLQYADPVRVASALNANGWKDTVTAVYSGLGHLLNLTYARPQNTQWGVIDRNAVTEMFSGDPMGNNYYSSNEITEGQNLGWGTHWSSAAWTDADMTFGAGTGRIQSSVTAGGTFGFVYDSAGSTRFVYETAPGNSLMDRASYHGADGRLRAAESRGAFTTNPGNWTSPGWQVTFEEYRYDALGRRILVTDRRDCHVTDMGGYQLCQQGRVRRTIWDGARELWEIQMPARAGDSLWIENDVQPVTYWAGLYFNQGFEMWMDPNPLFGRLAYTHAGGVDRPITLTRFNMVRRPQNEGFTYWNPVVLAPHWNWRGQADFGTFGDGGVKSCVDPSHCVRNVWRQIAFSVSVTPESWGLTLDQSHTGWFGTLINGKEDGTGTQYRRNRYVDPTTGRFTQEDPIGLAGGLNLYGFAGGDPVTFSDPFGLKAGCPPCKEPAKGPPVKLPPGRDGQWPNPWVRQVPSDESRRAKWTPRYRIKTTRGGQPDASWDSDRGHWDVNGGEGGASRKFLPDGTEVDHNNQPVESPGMWPWERMAMIEACFEAGPYAPGCGEPVFGIPGVGWAPGVAVPELPMLRIPGMRIFILRPVFVP